MCVSVGFLLGRLMMVGFDWVRLYGIFGLLCCRCVLSVVRVFFVMV